MKRGEIYYIARRGAVGAEIQNARPAIIVSNDILNTTSGVVEVVYLTAQPKKNLPTHATIEATGMTSTALCEQIDAVSVLLVGDYCGTCSEAEMEAVNRALCASLDLAKRADDKAKPKKEHDPVNHPSHYTSGKIETIDFIEDKGLGFHLGNAVKYITRAGKKDPTKTVEDLRKAIWYVTREIEHLRADA